MEYQKLSSAIIDDLIRISRHKPNERLPKEEQIRSRIYATLLSQYEVVCTERGYSSIDDKSGIECDVWTMSRSGQCHWLELKRCWHISEPGWNNKPSEQLRSWGNDLKKLSTVPTKEIRTFLLVGTFDVDPSGASPAGQSGVLKNVYEFHPKNLCHFTSQGFSWRESPISHLGIWVWEWQKNEIIAI